MSAVLAELWGLFVDDGPFALGILAWLLGFYALSRLGLPAGLAGLALFAGFAALLLASVLRAGSGGPAAR